MPFTLPTQMFLACLLHVTHISAKTPHLSQAQARIIARSSLKQFFMLLALQKQRPFLHFMLYVDLATQAAFLEKELHPAGERFIEADEEEVISGFSALGVSVIPSIGTLPLIEKFVLL